MTPIKVSFSMPIPAGVMPNDVILETVTSENFIKYNSHMKGNPKVHMEVERTVFC